MWEGKNGEWTTRGMLVMKGCGPFICKTSPTAGIISGYATERLQEQNKEFMLLGALRVERFSRH
jgi:uncharacterized protein YceK